MSSLPRQMPLDLPHREALNREDFLVAACNEEAVALIDHWPGWVSPAAVIYGPHGCGKTHLLNVFKKKSGAVEFAGAALTAKKLSDLVGGAMCAALDDADKIAGSPEKEEALFHLYNMMKERGGHLLLTSVLAPRHWPLALKDLSSRIVSSVTAGIWPPDDAMMAAVLLKLFHDRQMIVSGEIVGYLTDRMTRSFDAAKRTVSAIDVLSLEEKRGITLPLVRRVLEKREERT